VNDAHVFLDEDEEVGWYIEETIPGSTIADVLRMTQWEENELIRRVKVQVDEAIRSDRLKPAEGIRLQNSYERALKGYTYLNVEPKANGG
jgi:arginine decarboxylase